MTARGLTLSVVYQAVLVGGPWALVACGDDGAAAGEGSATDTASTTAASGAATSTASSGNTDASNTATSIDPTMTAGTDASGDTGSGSCGDAVVQPPETCDVAIMAGDPGACPAVCDDMDACTTDSLEGADCTAECMFLPITELLSGDGCCPPTGDNNTDTDCPVACDNGVLEMGETCDPAATCPIVCDDMDMCTMNVMTGSAANCDVMCSFLALPPGPMDGCCPAGANNNTDPDCPVICGNNVIEMGEQCDDGNMTGGDGCDANCQIEVVVPTAFRISEAYLRDPHIFGGFGLGCFDLTDFGANGINATLNSSLTTDSDGDGFLETNWVMVFRPLSQGGSIESMDLASARCTAPLMATVCDLPPMPMVSPTSYSNLAAGTCLAPLPGTTSGYMPPVPSTVAPPQCWVAANFSFDFDFLGILIPLTDVQVAANYVGNPATGMTGGLLRGFIDEATADATIIPAGTPVIGGLPLSAVLPGGTGTCAMGDDRDTVGVTTGWWFYIEAPTIDVVTWVGP